MLVVVVADRCVDQHHGYHSNRNVSDTKCNSTIGGIVVYLGLFLATHHPASDDGGDRRHNQHGQPQ